VAPIVGNEYAFCPATNAAYDSRGCVHGSSSFGDGATSDSVAVPGEGAWVLRVAHRDAAGNTNAANVASTTPLRFDATPPSGAAAMTPDPTAVVERYLAAIADLRADPDAFDQLVAPDARFVEHPSLVAPSGRRRDVIAARAGLEHGRALLAEQAIDVLGHVACGDAVVTRAVWTGALAVDAGPLPAGTALRAQCCMVFTVRDGRIVHQENYDCYDPVEAVSAAA
jgi:ketosteroid isomerase-like protein